MKMKLGSEWTSVNPAQSVHVTQTPSEMRLHKQSPIFTHSGVTSAKATMATGLGNLLASLLLLAPKPELKNTTPFVLIVAPRTSTTMVSFLLLL